MPHCCILVFPLVSRPGRSQGLLYKHLCDSLINWRIDYFPPIALRCRQTQTVRDSSSSYKIDYVIVVKNFLNPKGHQNCITGSKVTVILVKGVDFAYCLSCIETGLRLQPAQQACFTINTKMYNRSGFCRNLSVKQGCILVCRGLNKFAEDFIQTFFTFFASKTY